jgi:hypothetical protein
VVVFLCEHTEHKYPDRFESSKGAARRCNMPVENRRTAPGRTFRGALARDRRTGLAVRATMNRPA